MFPHNRGSWVQTETLQRNKDMTYTETWNRWHFQLWSKPAAWSGVGINLSSVPCTHTECHQHLERQFQACRPVRHPEHVKERGADELDIKMDKYAEGQKLTVYISLSVADAKTVLTKSIASASESGVTASCTCHIL